MRSTKGKPGLVWLPVVAWLAIVGTNSATAQMPSPPPMPSVGGLDRSSPSQRGDDPLSAMQQKAMKDQLEKRNKMRQQQLVADTDKLLKLANELKVEVDKSSKDTLSLTVVKKSEEIEKLARSVKEKMKSPM